MGETGTTTTRQKETDQRISRLEETVQAMMMDINKKFELLMAAQTVGATNSTAQSSPPADRETLHPTSPIQSADTTSLSKQASPRTSKIDLPRFDSTQPDTWIFKAEQNFMYYEIPEDQRFSLISAHLDGPAILWFKSLHKNLQLTTWDRFKDCLMHRFGRSPFRDLRGELAQIEQTRTVQEYYDRFEELANQVDGVPPSMLQSCFETGLRRDIRREVRALQPQSLEHAFQLGKLMEDRFADIPIPPPFPYGHPFPYPYYPPLTGQSTFSQPSPYPPYSLNYPYQPAHIPFSQPGPCSYSPPHLLHSPTPLSLPHYPPQLSLPTSHTYPYTPHNGQLPHHIPPSTTNPTNPLFPPQAPNYFTNPTATYEQQFTNPSHHYPLSFPT